MCKQVMKINFSFAKKNQILFDNHLVINNKNRKFQIFINSLKRFEIF